jgi:magnesium transporter
MRVDEAISQEFLRAHPVEAVRVLEGMKVEDMAAFLESGGKRQAVAVLPNMESSNGARCLALWPDAFVTDVLKSLPISQCVRMLRLVESVDRQRMLSLVPPELARTLSSLLDYPEGTAASHMDPRYVAYPRDLRVGETWKRSRRRRRHAGFYVYVVDREGVLVGSIAFNGLLSADPRRSLGEVMSTPVQSILAHATGRAILEHPGWRIYPDLPVVDESGVLLGVLRYSAFKELELAGSTGRQRAVWNVAQELGELYWAGSSQILRELAAAVLSVHPAKEKTHGR